MSPSTKMLSHSWNLRRFVVSFLLPTYGCPLRKTYLLQFNGSVKVPGLSQTKGLHLLDFLPSCVTG